MAKEKLSDGEDGDVRMVKTFIETKAPSIHDAFAEKAGHFDEKQKRYVVRQPYNELLEELERLGKEMSSTTHGATTEVIEVNLVSCTWEEVMSQLEAAKEACRTYRERPKGWKNIHWKLMRKVEDSAAVVSPALDAIPDELGLSVLKGGLAFVFSVAKHRGEIAAKILQAFEGIPDALRMAEQQRVLYPDDEGLRRSIEDLHRTFVEVIPQWINYLVPKKTTHKLTSPFKQSHVDAKLADVARASQRVRDCAQRLRDGDIAETVALTKGISVSTRATEVAVTDINTQLSAVRESLLLGPDDLEARIRGILEEERRKVHEEAVKGKNQLFRFLMGQLQDQRRLLREFSLRQAQRDEQARRDHRLQMQQMQIQSQQQALLYQERPRHQDQDMAGQGLAGGGGMAIPGVDPALLEDLMQALDVPMLQPAEDLQAVLRKRRAFDAAAQAQARSLWNTQTFQAWLSLGLRSNTASSSAAAGSLLLVDANTEAVKTGKISPISLFCAGLVVELGGEDEMQRPGRGDDGYYDDPAAATLSSIWLHFFCGQHTTSADPLRGAAGMVRSLLAQLVRQAYARGVLSSSFAVDLRRADDMMSEEEGRGHPGDEHGHHEQQHSPHHHRFHLHNPLHRLHHHHQAGSANSGGGKYGLSALCFLLQQALARLFPGVQVLCVIDGVSLYETNALRDDMLFVFRRLRGMAGDNFRVMLTSAARSKVLVREVPPAQHVLLRRGGGGTPARGGAGGVRGTAGMDKSFWRSARANVGSKAAGRYRYGDEWEVADEPSAQARA